MITTKFDATASAGEATTMRAAIRRQYGPAAGVRLAEIAKPQIGDDEVLVQVQAAGLDRGVWHLMTGMPYAVRVAGFGVRAPKNPVLGGDVAGVVAAIGKSVTRFHPGDQVYGVASGSFAEYAAADEDKLVRKPDNVTFEQAAAVPTSALTALQALRDQGRIQAGQKVLVIGASGGVGSFAVLLAKAFGAEVTGVCRTAKVDLVRSLGADHVIDYTRENFAGGQSYDLIIDIGGNRKLSLLRRALTPHGTLVIVGGEGGGTWVGMGRQFKALLISPFVRQRLRIFITAQRLQDLEFLTNLIEAGRLTPAIDRTYGLSQVPDAMRRLEEGRARGKVVITV
jgi:NADPH:quinone reductase-like Zn-dependent oxidoreductase